MVVPKVQGENNMDYAKRKRETPLGGLVATWYREG